MTGRIENYALCFKLWTVSNNKNNCGREVLQVKSLMKKVGREK